MVQTHLAPESLPRVPVTPPKFIESVVTPTLAGSQPGFGPYALDLLGIVSATQTVPTALASSVVPPKVNVSVAGVDDVSHVVSRNFVNSGAAVPTIAYPAPSYLVSVAPTQSLSIKPPAKTKPTPIATFSIPVTNLTIPSIAPTLATLVPALP